MKEGWFIGNFVPCVYKTKHFDVSYKFHKKGEYRAPHIHKITTEINYLIQGKMKIAGKTLQKGDIFIISKGERADPIYLTTCKLIVVKIPSNPTDKYLV